uniref:Uncharacterized protein n=1 Tax=Molossus molossus TaxID=27622 RepID=A0A7J8DBY8_MOLMO|nr:hypothetical protein HJG59_009378 [Molossus molossus]
MQVSATPGCQVWPLGLSLAPVRGNSPHDPCQAPLGPEPPASHPSCGCGSGTPVPAHAQLPPHGSTVHDLPALRPEPAAGSVHAWEQVGRCEAPLIAVASVSAGQGLNRPQNRTRREVESSGTGNPAPCLPLTLN